LVISDIGMTILAKESQRLLKLDLGGCERSYDGIKAIGQCCQMMELNHVKMLHRFKRLRASTTTPIGYRTNLCPNVPADDMTFVGTVSSSEGPQRQCFCNAQNSGGQTSSQGLSITYRDVGDCDQVCEYCLQYLPLPFSTNAQEDDNVSSNVRSPLLLMLRQSCHLHHSDQDIDQLSVQNVPADDQDVVGTVSDDIKQHHFYKESSEEEVAKIMAETMEQYMSKTYPGYGSGVARPTINDKDHFELKCQFLKELRDNTFSGSDHEDANEHIEKVLEIGDLFLVPNITQDQIMLRVFPITLDEVSSTLLNGVHEVILFYNGLEVPTRQILDSKGAIPSKTVADAKVAIQEMAEFSQKMALMETSRTRSTKTSDGLAAIQAQLNSLGREIKKVNEKVYVAQVGCEQCKGPHYTKDCPLKEEGKTLEEAYYT
ncbi:hypothetical protein Tco_0349714, partial [Tanacetum coccineum]